MARMRDRKLQLREWLESPQWKTRLAALTALDGREVVGPLLSFLLRGGDMTARAAVGLGMCVARLAEDEPEAARNIIRRFMWHMNEESGNIGWGMPEAFAETLARSPRMAEEFHSILLSYIMDTGRDDNYCDHDVLRRSCFWAAGRLAQARPDLCAKALPWLVKGLDDADLPCRGMAAWAIGRLPPSAPGQSRHETTLKAEPALRRLAARERAETCFVFDGDAVRERRISDLARETLETACRR